MRNIAALAEPKANRPLLTPEERKQFRAGVRSFRALRHQMRADRELPSARPIGEECDQ